MQIFFKNIIGHLPGLSYEESPDIKSISAPWFWVVHPVKSAQSFLEDASYSVGATDCIDRGGAILFLKGSRYAGMDNENEAEDLEKKYNDRVHCLRVACDGSSTKIVARIQIFLEKVLKADPYQPIPWEEVEPPKWPESIVAVYLLLKAIEASPKDADTIRQAWRELNPGLRTQLWNDAWVEYHKDRALEESEWTDAALPTPSTPELELPEGTRMSKAIELLKSSISG